MRTSIHHSILILFFGVIVMLLPQLLYGQFYMKIYNYNADTIYPKLENASDEQSMTYYNQLAFYHSHGNYDSTMYYANKALELAEIFNNEFEKATSYRNMGNAYCLRGDYQHGLYKLHMVLAMFRDIGDKRRIIELTSDIAKVNYDLDDFEKAVEYGEEMIDICRQEELSGNSLWNKFEEAIWIGSVAVACRELGEYEKAIDYFRHYIVLSNQLKIPPLLHKVFIQSMAETFTKAGQYDSALVYTYYAISFLSKNKNKPENEHTGEESAIGRLLYLKGDYINSIPLLKKEYEVDKLANSYYYAALSAVYIGDIFYKTQNFDSTWYYYNEGLRLLSNVIIEHHQEFTDTTNQTVYSGYQRFFNINQSEVLQRYYKLRMLIHKRLFRLYNGIEGPSEALSNYILYTKYKDSLNSVLVMLEKRRLQLRYETEFMEQQLTALEIENSLSQDAIEKNKIITITSISIVVLILILTLILFRQQHIKVGQEKLLLKQRLLRSQMNPHFIFNSLASIQNFIVKQDDKNASIYLSRFSDLVRSILNNSLEEKISLDEEINTVENYLELQKVRFPDRFDYKLDIDESLDTESIEIPPMLAQPFIENAIEHGIKHKKIKGLINVRLINDGYSLIYEIEDDGIGREKAKSIIMSQNREHKSLATVLTYDRIRVLNKRFKSNISLNIEDLTDDFGEPKGTKVIFNIPKVGIS